MDITVKCGDLDKTFKVAAWQRHLHSPWCKDKSRGAHIVPGRIARDPEKFEAKLKAESDKSFLSFVSPMGHCMDIGNVQLTLDPTTTTTTTTAAKSGLKGRSGPGMLLVILVSILLL